jgi:signal transduction histidine kinase/CheY-like chemotaxis protein
METPFGKIRIMPSIFRSLFEDKANLTDQLRIITVVFSSYVILGQISRMIFFLTPSAPTVILSPMGLSLAFFVLYGYRIWPVIFLAAVVNGFLASFPPLLIVISSAGILLQASLGLFILNKFGFSAKLSSLRDGVSAVFVSVFVTAIVPTVNNIGRWLTDTQSPSTWALLWSGGILSTILVFPFVVRIVSNPQFKSIKRNIEETVIVFTLLTGVNIILFWTSYGALNSTIYVIAQLFILTWMSLRMGMTRMTTAMIGTAIIGFTGIYMGFAEVPDIPRKVLGTEVYLIIFSVLFYIISTINEEKEVVIGRFKKNLENLTHAYNQINMNDRRKNEFIAVLAHELRNPLSPIVNYLQIMEVEGVDDTKFKYSAEGINRQIKKISRILEDLLDISRITQGKIKIEKEKTDIRSIIKKAVESVRSSIDEKQQILTVQLPHGQANIFGDPVRLEQVIVNLLNNSIRYTSEKGKIWLLCEVDDGGNISITVRDNGVGIKPEVLPHIFDMFQQGDSTLVKTSGGLGIGLGLVKAFTELHGGSVKVKSDGSGKGAEFILTFPGYQGNEKDSTEYSVIKDLSPVKSTNARASIKKTNNKNGKKILVVDDNEETVATLTSLLNFLGHKVFTATNGRAAIDSAINNKPDAVLLDIGLPDITGYEVAKEIREKIGQGVKLIAISGYGQRENKLEAHRVGFDHYLTKPVRISYGQDRIQSGGGL